MGRRYRTALFRDKMERIRLTIPDAFIGVDLIAGARGETLDEFRRSHDFVESLDISRLHVFPYSERPGTRALTIDHIVTQEEKHRRTLEMIELSNRKLLDFSRRFEGTSRDVLLEHPHANNPMSGFTDNYLRIIVDNATPDMDNKIKRVRIISAIEGTEEMKGELV